MGDLGLVHSVAIEVLSVLYSGEILTHSFVPLKSFPSIWTNKSGQECYVLIGLDQSCRTPGA